jgi:hypothetical protein
MAVTTQLNTGTTPLAVTNGGTGTASTVAYAPICGGTTTTSALQKVASLGTSGQFLKSNGSALPTYVTPTELGTAPVIYQKFPISPTQIMGMFATPVQLVAAGGAHTSYCVRACIYELLFNSIAYTSGGVYTIQFGSSAGLGGPREMTAFSAASLNVSTNSVIFQLWDTGLSFLTTAVNQGLYFSNATGAFASGNSTLNIHLYYQLIATTM